MNRDLNGRQLITGFPLGILPTTLRWGPGTINLHLPMVAPLLPHRRRPKAQHLLNIGLNLKLPYPIPSQRNAGHPYQTAARSYILLMLRESRESKDSLVAPSQNQSSNSTPCLKDRNVNKMLSPDSSRRLLSRKPESTRNVDMRPKKLVEEAREFAGFYSPTSASKQSLNQSSLSALNYEKPAGNQTSQNSLATSRTSNPNTPNRPAFIPIPSPISVHYQKPRQSSNFTSSQFQTAPTVTTPGSTQCPLSKKIHILQIQLQAVTMQNTRLKEHINLLRGNNQQLKTRLASGSASAKTEEITSGELGELRRLRQTVAQLQEKLLNTSNELDNERKRLEGWQWEYAEKERKFRESLLQLEAIIVANKRDNSLLKSTNQQLALRLWHCQRQVGDLQAAERKRKSFTISLIKRQRMVSTRSRAQFDARQEELFELSPERT